MSVETYGLSARSLSELSLVVSRVARNVLAESAVPSADSLRLFWQSSRSLERRWMALLDEWTTLGTVDIEALERLAPRVFASEMLVRTFSTVLAGLDQQRGCDDMVRLARNSVNGLMRIRNGILSRLLTIPNHANHRVLEVDRTRRRCDRWTDMLLGPIANLSGCYEFAFDAERARDFGEESFVEDRLTGPNVAEHLVAAGMRLKFVQYLPDDMVSEPELICLSQSILSSIPKLNFHRDGSFRSVLERQVAASRHRMEQRAVIAQTPYEIEDVPQMRIDLSKKRREDES